MKTLIAYASRHGCSEKAAKFLSEIIADSIIINLDKKEKVNLKDFEAVIIGGSIHIGGVQKTVKKFRSDNFMTLLKKQIDLYLCCMYEGAPAIKQFESAFVPELREKAAAKDIFGGEFNFEKMSFIERVIVKKVANASQSVSNLDYNKIKEFSKYFIA